MKSQVARKGRVYGGVYVWNFEAENLSDVHDGHRDIVDSLHHIDFTNEGNTDLSYEWDIRFELLGSTDKEVLIPRNDQGSGVVAPGQRVQIPGSLRVDVGPFRPGSVGFRGRTRLRIDGEKWFCREIEFPFHLAAGH